MAIGLALRGASMAGRAGGMGARAETGAFRDMKNLTEKINKMAGSGDFSFLKDNDVLRKFGGKEGVLKHFGINENMLGKFGGKEETSFNPYKKQLEEQEKEKKEGGIANENFKDSPKEKHSFKSKHGGHDVSKANYYDLNVEDVDSVPTYTKEPGSREMKLRSDITEEDLKELRERLAKGEDIQNLRSDTGELKDLRSDTGELKDVEENGDTGENGNPIRKNHFFEGLKDVTEVVNKVMELEGGESAALEGVEAAADFEVGPGLDNQRIQKALKNAKTKKPSTSSYSSASTGPSSHVSGEPISKGPGTGPTSFQRGGSGSGPQIWDPVREQSVPRYNYTKPLNVEKSNIKLQEELEELKNRDLNKGITSDDDVNDMLKDKDEVTEVKEEKWKKDVYAEIDNSIEEINDLLKDKDKDNGKSNDKDKDDNKDNDKNNDKNRDELERKVDKSGQENEEYKKEVDKLMDDKHEKVGKLIEDGKKLGKSKFEKILDTLEKIQDFTDPLNQQARNADPDEALMQLLEKYMPIKVPGEEDQQQQQGNNDTSIKDMRDNVKKIKKIKGKFKGGKVSALKSGVQESEHAGPNLKGLGVRTPKAIDRKHSPGLVKSEVAKSEAAKSEAKGEAAERQEEPNLGIKKAGQVKQEANFEQIQENGRSQAGEQDKQQSHPPSYESLYPSDNPPSYESLYPSGVPDATATHIPKTEATKSEAKSEASEAKSEASEAKKTTLSDRAKKAYKFEETFIKPLNQAAMNANDPGEEVMKLMEKAVGGSDLSLGDEESNSTGNNGDSGTKKMLEDKWLNEDKKKNTKNKASEADIGHHTDSKKLKVGHEIHAKNVEHASLKNEEHKNHITLEDGGHKNHSERRGMKRERDEEGSEEDGPLKKKVRKVPIQRQRAEVEQKQHEEVEVEAAIQQQEAQIGRKEQNKEEVEETIQREETEAKREDQREAQRIEAAIQQEVPEAKELEAAIQLNKREGLWVEGAVEEAEEVKNQWKMGEESEVVRAERESELRITEAEREATEASRQWDIKEEPESVVAEREAALRITEAEREATEASRQWDIKEEPESVVAEREAALRITEAEREATEASRQWDIKEEPESVVAEREAALRITEAEREAVIEPGKDSRAEQEKQNREVEAADFEQLEVTQEKDSLQASLKQEGESSSASHGQWDQGHDLVSNENLPPSYDRTPVSKQDEVVPTKKEDKIPDTPASEQELTTFSNRSTASIDSGYQSREESLHKVAPRDEPHKDEPHKDEPHKDAGQTRSEMSQTLDQPSSFGQDETGGNGAAVETESLEANNADKVRDKVQMQPNHSENMLASENLRINVENAARVNKEAAASEEGQKKNTQEVRNVEEKEIQNKVKEIDKSTKNDESHLNQYKEKNDIKDDIENITEDAENNQARLNELQEEVNIELGQSDQDNLVIDNSKLIQDNHILETHGQDYQQSDPHFDENVYPSDKLATSESDYQSATSETYGQSNNEVFTESQYQSDNGSSVFKQNEGSRAGIPNTLEQPLAQRSFAQDAAMAEPRAKTLGVNTVNEVDDVQTRRNNSEEGSPAKELHKVEMPNGERLEGRTPSDTSKLGNQPLEKGKANFENVTREKEERKQQENDAELRTTEQQRMNKLQEESPLSPASILEDKPVKEVAATVPGVPDATATHIPNEVEDQSNDLPTGLEQLQRFQLEEQRRVKDVLESDDHRREEAKTTNSLSDEIALEEKIPSTDNRSEISPREIPQTPQEKEQTKKELDPPDNKVLEAKKVENASETDRDKSRYIRKKTQMEAKKEEKATLQKAASQDTKKRNVGTAVGGDKGSAATGMQDGEVARMRDVDNGGVPKQSIGPTADRLEQSIGSNVNANDGSTRNAQVNANTEASGNRQSGLTPESTVRNHDEVRLERTEDPVEHRDKVHQNEARKQQSELRPEDPARDHHEIHLEDSRGHREAHKDDSAVDPSEKIGTPNRNREIHAAQSDQATRDGDEALRRNQQTSAEQLEGQRLRQESQIGEPQTVREVTTRVPDRATDSSEPNRVKDPSNTTATDMVDKVEDRPNDNLPEVLKVSQQYLEAQQRLESQKQHIKNAEAHDQEAPGHDDGRREVENIESIHKDTSDYIPSDASLTATPETLEEKVYEGAKKLNSPDHQLSQDVDKAVDNTSETHLQSNSADMPLLDRKAPKAESNRSPEGAVLRKTSEGGPRVIKRKVGSPKQNVDATGRQNVDATGRQNVDTRGGVPKQSIGASKSKVDKVEDAIKAQGTPRLENNMSPQGNPSLERSVNPQGNPSLEGTIKQQNEVHHEGRVEQQNTHSSEVASNQVTGDHEGELRQPEELNQRRTSDGQLHSQDPRIVETKAVTDVATTALEPSDRAATDPVDDKKHEIPEKNNSAADLNQRERRVDGSDNSNTLQSMDPIKEVQKNVSEGINRIEINASERMREAEKSKLEEVKPQENGYLDEFKKLLATTPLQEKIVEKLYEGATKNGANIEEIRDYIKGNEDIKKDLRGWLDHKEKFIGSVIDTAKTREGKLNYEDELRYEEIGHNIYDRLHNAGTPRENISEFRSVIEENKENFKAFLDKNGKDISFKDIAEWAANQSRSDRSGVGGIPEPYSEGVSRLQQETQMPRAIGVQGS